MCGIAGKLSPREAVDPLLLERMCEVIEHRGPDSRGTFLDEGVGLGIQRLRVIDLETGDQPVFNEDRSVVVVLNGEIYNHVELRNDLSARGHRFSTASDTEVIVHLYEEHGDDCVQYLRGMFAFALWDRRRRRLLLARDRVGKKPLFYALRNGTLWFGSEAKSILQDPVIPRDVDLDAIDAYLQFQYVPGDRSAFAALKKLPPAHTLVWDDGEVALKRYWRLSYADKLKLAGEHEAHDLIREKLLEATRLRLRSDVPLGALLSGGVDSGAVVAAMAMTSDQRVKTFSIGFDVAELDETAHARQVAERYDTDHHELRVEPDALSILPQLVWHYGEPFADASAIPSFTLAKLTREHVTVALNGDGGDEAFGGYTRYWANALARRLRGVPRPLARAVAATVDRRGTGGREDSFRARLARMAHGLSMSAPDRYAMWVAHFPPRERELLYEPAFRQSFQATLAPALIREPWADSDATDVIDRMLDVDTRTYLPGDLLVKMDIATMAHSLEVRSPLLDHELLELAARLPSNLKVPGRTTKHVLREAVRPWLPDAVLDRPKQGFNVPLRDWFRGPLRELPGEILLDPATVGRGWFSEARVSALIDEHHAGTFDHSKKIWSLLMLELWLRTYVDAAAPRPLTLSAAA
jgi:asparagine synthase (glutamine-hydrolysing)